MFRNFRAQGFLSVNDDLDGASTAEIAFLHSVFENCGTGISFTSFNDYDYTFDGCLFKNNLKVAVECLHGNFYIRNTRFESNALDVMANPEHGSSIRRSVSNGSGTFLKSSNSISPITVEQCFIANWKGSSAIVSSGAPLTLFDNTFKHSEPTAVPLQADSGQSFIMAANQLVGPAALSPQNLPNAVSVELPFPKAVLNENTSFIPAVAVLPGKHFDAKRDFGATGDGRADDTVAIQKAIDAARTFGQNGIAYLPAGNYRITHPLEVSGANYGFGGSGYFSRIIFAGSPDDNAINVHPDGKLTVENLMVVRDGCSVKDRNVIWVGGKGADIRQFPSKGGSRVRYHNVYWFGKYCHGPFILGLRLEDLSANDTVLIENTEGNIHSINSGAATILAPISYEGTVWVKGAARGGILGILTRLATLSQYSIFVEDNQSLIASDFYIEQAVANTITLRGNPGKPPGRITLSDPKLDLARAAGQADASSVNVDNYFGEINFVATQLYPPSLGAQMKVLGGGTTLQIFGCFCNVKEFVFVPKSMNVNMLSSLGSNGFTSSLSNFPGIRHDPARARNALLDLRRLGELDWKLNYPALLK